MLKYYLSLSIGTTMMILFYTFSAFNIIAFVLMRYDKKRAQNNKRRVSEKTLLAFVCIGGTLGSGLGMLFFRHKTAKRSYLLKFWGIVIIQIALIYLSFQNDLLHSKYLK